MKSKIKCLLAVMVLGVIIATSSAMAVTGTMQKDVTYRNIKVTLDGAAVETKDAAGNYVEPFIMDGTTYLPVRSVAGALGLGVNWNNETSTVELSKSGNKVDLSAEINEIIRGTRNFVDPETWQWATVKTLPQINDWYMGKPYRYCIIDLDGDGAQEIIVEYDTAGDTAVLHKEGDAWMAYWRSYRMFSGLKADGTITSSDGAEISYVERVVFNKYGMGEIIEIQFDDYYEEYIVGGVLVDREQCLAELSVYNAKPDARYVDFK